MFAFFGGGNSIPGVSSDDMTPGGEIIAGGLTAGDLTAQVVPSFHHFRGYVNLRDVLANQIDADDVLDVYQTIALVGNNDTSAVFILRSGALNGFDYTEPELLIVDNTTSVQPSLQVIKRGTVVLELTTQKSITGALASVTDANAKAVLTSIIATLTGIKVAVNNTT